MQPAPRSSPSPPRRGLLAALIALAALVRLPFWLEALRLPVDGDTAIVGLMARHGKLAATFWGQPYGSPLDAWVAAPFVALLGSTAPAVRLPVFLLGLLPVPLAWALARRLHPAAAAPAALLMACPPSYLLLLSALPPPVYPVILPLLGGLLLGAAVAGAHLGSPEGPRARVLLGLSVWGLGAGLALWTHLVALAVVLPALACLVWSARATPGRVRQVLAAVLPGLLIASAPLWMRLARDPSATAVVSLGDDRHALWAHLRALLPRAHEPLLGLLGAHTPTTADDPLNRVGLPPAGVWALAALYAIGLWRAARITRRAWRFGAATGRRTAGLAWLLGSAVALTLLAFPWPQRAGPETLRFLTPAYLPLAVLVAWAPAAEGHRRGAWVVVLTLASLHLVPATRLLEVWRASGTDAPLLPDCRPVLRLLDERGLRRAWASYDTAWCLTYLSAERVIASQPWNERFPELPPRHRDEVRFARDVAWVLVPGADFDLPAPERFEARLRAGGGSFRRTAVGQALVYDRFEPPFAPQGEPPAGAGAAGDGDLATRVIEPGRGATTLHLEAPMRLAALTLAGGLAPPGLPAGFDLDVSADGVRFERAARLRAGRGAREIVWANGQPMAREALQVISVPLAGRQVVALRLTPVPEQGPWSLAEVLLHPAAAPGAWFDERPPDAEAWAARALRVSTDVRARDAGWMFRRWLVERPGG